METVPEFTNQGIPSNGNPSPFPSFGNIGAPYMEMLSLSGLTIGLLVWLFSTPMVPNVQDSSERSLPPHEQFKPHVDPKVYPSSSSLASSPHSSSSPGESLDSSN